MAAYLGDYSTGSTVFFRFTTFATTGPAIAFSSGAITVFRNASTVANTTGITLTSTFAGRTGLNSVQIDMAGTSTFYQPGSHFSAVVSSGGTSDRNLAGFVLREWSITGRGPVLLSSSAVSTDTITAGAAAYLGLSAAIGMTVQTGETYSTASSDSVVKLIKEGTIEAISSDTYQESTAGVPSTARSIAGMMSQLYTCFTGQIIVSSSAKTFHNRAGGFLFGKVLTQDSTGSTGIYTEAAASSST